jgi:hypothetical protein
VFAVDPGLQSNGEVRGLRPSLETLLPPSWVLISFKENHRIDGAEEGDELLVL